MALAFDAVSSGAVASSSLTVSHVCAAGAYLVVAAATITRSDFASVTYNETAMTQSFTYSSPNNVLYRFYTLSNPTSGTHDVVATLTAGSNSGSGSDYIGLGNITFTGAGGVGATASNAASSGSPSIAITTTVANSYIIDALCEDQSSTSISSFDASTVKYNRTDFIGSAGFGGSIRSTPTVQGYTNTATLSQGGIDWNYVAIEIKEVAATTTSSSSTTTSSTTSTTSSTSSSTTTILMYPFVIPEMEITPVKPVLEIIGKL